MWELIIIVALILFALIYAQERHYQFIEEERDNSHSLELDAQLSKTLKEFEDYKKRVDALTLRAGFKL